MSGWAHPSWSELDDIGEKFGLGLTNKSEGSEPARPAQVKYDGFRGGPSVMVIGPKKEGEREEVGAKSNGALTTNSMLDAAQKSQNSISYIDFGGGTPCWMKPRIPKNL